MLQRIKTFFSESYKEFKRVNWPTFAQTRRLTLIVVSFSLATAIFLGTIDFALSKVLNMVV